MREKIRSLNNIAIPLLLQSISSLLIGLGDQAMVGRISIPAFSAVGTVTSLLTSIAGILGVISVTFNIRGSKCVGRDDLNDLQDEFTSIIFLDVIIGIIFFVVLMFFKSPILITIFAFTDIVLKEAISYLSAMQFYILIQMLLFTFSAIFKIQKKTKWIFWGSTSAAVLDLILNYVLIFGKLGFKPMGVTGAALSTIISLTINLLFYIYLCRYNITFNYRKFKVYVLKMKKISYESISLIGQEFLEGSIFIIAVNAILSRIGTKELSAYLITINLINIILMPMYMYGSATLTLVSENSVFKDKRDIYLLPKLGLMMSMIFYAILSVIFWILRRYIPMIITNESELIMFSANILIFMIISNIFNPVHSIYKYGLQALGKSTYVLFTTTKVNIISFIIMIITTGYIGLGLYGIYIGMFINYALLSIVFVKKYNKIFLKDTKNVVYQ